MKGSKNKHRLTNDEFSSIVVMLCILAGGICFLFVLLQNDGIVKSVILPCVILALILVIDLVALIRYIKYLRNRKENDDDTR